VAIGPALAVAPARRLHHIKSPAISARTTIAATTTPAIHALLPPPFDELLDPDDDDEDEDEDDEEDVSFVPVDRAKTAVEL
jgi:hypothetical protein